MTQVRNLLKNSKDKNSIKSKEKKNERAKGMSVWVKKVIRDENIKMYQDERWIKSDFEIVRKMSQAQGKLRQVKEKQNEYNLLKHKHEK